MKKLVSKLLCGILLSSVVLCGCNQATEPTATVTSETETQTEVTTTTAETEPVQTTVDDRPEINVDNVIKVTDLYKSKEPDGSHAVTIKTDGIRGSAMYHVNGDGSVHFGYHSGYGSSISTSILSGKRTMDVTLSLDFKGMKTNILLTGQTSIDGLESFIDAVIANEKEKFHIYNDMTLDAYAEQVKKDLPILYARFIAYADQAFPELGLKYEDLGVRLGTKYRSVDYTQTTSMETTVANPNTYKNGVSANKKKVWTEFYYNAVGKLGGMTGKGWHSAYGEKSSSMLTQNDYVQYSATDKKYGEMLYHKMSDDAKEPGESFWIYVNNTSTKKKKKVSVSMRYELYQKDISLGKGIYTSKYTYWVTISAAPGQYGKVFESKESLKKYVKVQLLLSNKKGKIKSLSGKKAFNDKMKKSFEADGCKYYTQNELIDILWEHHENFLASLDHGLSGMGTSLSDIGVNWKK
ncbi:MAG: hypothetical protein J5623_09635 [Clostridiales bacterium]|nr:hypothetical protein [Clostridiales bacterium]